MKRFNGFYFVFCVLLSGVSARAEEGLRIRFTDGPSFEALNPMGEDLVRGFADVVGRGGSSGVRGGGDVTKLNAIENYGELRGRQKSFWRELGAVDPARIRDDLRPKYAALLHANPAKIALMEKFRVLDRCRDGRDSSADVVLSAGSSDACIAVSSLSDAGQASLLLPTLILLRTGNPMSPSEYEDLTRASRNARTSLFRDYEARFRLGMPVPRPPSGTAECDWVTDDEVVRRALYSDLTFVFEIRRDFQAGFVISGKTGKNRGFYAKCVE